MQRFFKILSFCAFLCSFAVFALVGYAGLVYPDEYNIITGDFPDTGSLYSLKAVDTAADGVCVSLDTDFSTEHKTAQLMLLDIVPVKTSEITAAQRTYVVPLGDAFGIKLYTKGVVVVKTDEVTTARGIVNPAGEAGIKVGDIITAIDGGKVERNEDVSQKFADSGGKEIVLSIIRNGEQLTVRVRAALSAIDGKYKVGIWVRDSSAGIGTLTFYDRSTGIFAGLGHAVCDVDTGEIMPLSGGEAVEAEIKGSYRGESGTPGELCGVFGRSVIGKLLLNNDTGVYGMATNIKYSRKQLPVAMSYEVNPGNAQIIAEIDESGTKAYDVEIIKVSQNTDSHQKNMVIKVTDEGLIRKTGGIVQGMSGSPIIQNGMLVGAVTHVFVNNPLQGYAVFAQNMVKTADELSQSDRKMAS